MISLIGIVGTISTGIFAYLAFRRNGNNDIKNEAQKQGALFNDVLHIKQSIDRIESKLDKVEFNYGNLNERVIKLEQRLEAMEE